MELVGTNRRLPSGERANSLEEYFSAWDALIVPLQAALGWQTIAYDPGLLLRCAQTNDTIDLPVAFAQQLVARLAPPAPEKINLAA